MTSEPRRTAGGAYRRTRHGKECVDDVESARRVQEAIDAGVTEHSVEEWVSHPHALDDLMADMGVVSRRWLEATDEGRILMTHQSWKIYWANKAADAKLGIFRTQNSGLARRELDRILEVLVFWACADCDGPALFCGCVRDAMIVDLTKCDGPRNREASASLARAVVAAGVQPGVDDRDHT